MNVQTGVLGGFGAGMALMYLADPHRGRRRRVMIRDKAVSLAGHSGDALRKGGRDLGNRARGGLAEARSLLHFRSEPADDPVVEARIRSKMGRIVSHPSAIHVSVQDGHVTVSGPILEHEAGPFLKAIRSVEGVREIHNELELYEKAGDHPSLQGGRTRLGDVPELWQANWTPAVRWLAGVSGGALTAWGLARRDTTGTVAGFIGAGLLTRAITNLETRRLVGAGAGRRAVDVRKTITIHAPVEEVFWLWTNYENFPKFMRHIREVRDHGNGRSHWVADGPAGMSVTWDAEITRFERNRLLAWKSLPGSTVENAGVIRFDPTPEGHTRVHIQFSYNPPAGAAGHAIAWLFGRDLKSELDDDLVRFKSLIENGKTRSASGQRVTRWELDKQLEPSSAR